MNSFMSWVDDKKVLRGEVVRRLLLCCEWYIEVFDGGDWVLFHKSPGNDSKVYNDFNDLLTNLYHCVRGKPDLLINSLRYVLGTREDPDRARLALRRRRTTSVQWVAWFYQIIRQSYASAPISFGNQPHGLQADFPLIEQAHRRLARMVVENKGFEKLTRYYDRPESLFYCGLPHHYMEGHYPNIGKDSFTEKDYIRLRGVLLSIQGKFLLSYSDDGFVRELYDVLGIQIGPVTRLNNIRQQYDPNCQFAELFIANCDLHEREWSSIQLNLFDSDMKETGYEICKRSHFQGPLDPRGSHEVFWL